MADYVVYFLQWLHVLFVIYLIGSGFFFEIFAKPQIMSLPPQESGPVVMGISKKFTMFSHTAWAIIILSGIYRAFIHGGLNVFTLHESPYGTLLEMKMGLVAIAYVLSIYITKLGIDMSKAEPSARPVIVKRISLVSRSLIVLGLLIVLFAVGLANIQYLV